MKNKASILIGTGTLLTSISIFGDLVGLSGRPGIGAGQFLGINVGVGLILLGIGLLTINRSVGPARSNGWSSLLDRMPDLPPVFWVLAGFILVYLILFIFPVFITKPSIQYFTKYIPDAYVTHIGFDIDMTMGRVGRWLVTGNSPYHDLYYYSPLTLVIFAPLLLLGYPAYFTFSTMITVIAFIGSSLILPILMSRKQNLTLILLLFVTGLYSYGFQFELERGQYNVITFALALLAIYLFHYHERLWFYAYIIFSLAIQLKIYPIFLTVMFIRDWREWKINIQRIAGLALLNIALLFALGYRLFLDFVNNLTGVQLTYMSSRREDMSIAGFVLDLTTDGFGILPTNTLPTLAQHTALIEGIFFLIFGLCLVTIIAADYRRRQQGWNPHLLLIATIGMLVIPSASVDYKLPLLIAPLAILLSDLGGIKSVWRKRLSSVLILFASTAYWLTLYPFTVKPYIISRNFPALFVLLISSTLLYFARGDRDQEQRIR